jgi:putative endopeptidase
MHLSPALRRTLALLITLAGCEALPPTVAPLPPPPPPPPPPVASAEPVGPKKVQASLADVGLDETALDRNANACDDFYQFACGGWLARTEIPADKARWTRSFSEIQRSTEGMLKTILETSATSTDPVRKKIGEFYGACMDTAAVDKAKTKPIKPLLDVARQTRNGKALGKTLAELHKSQVWGLFSITDEQDFKDATRVIATLDQAGLGLPDRDYYLENDEKSTTIRQKYTEHVERMMVLVGLDKRAAKGAAKDILALETAIAKVSKSRVERRDPKGLYNKIDREGLQKLAPDIDWAAYFKGVGYPDLKDINVTSTAFFAGLNELVKTTKPAQWQTYLQWQVVHQAAPSLSAPLADEAFAFQKELTGQAQQRDRWKRCVSATDEALGDLLAQPFVAEKFTKESKKAVEQMVFAIRDAFGKRVDALDWMDDKTRARSKGKLGEMAYLIGYPSKWKSYEFAIDPKNHGANVLAAQAFEQRTRLAKVGKPVDREEWQMTPPTVNAYYEPLKNHMVFPAGILQPPFYNPKASVAVNMGGMGMVVGHELTHGFDDEGSQFAGNGNLEAWWTPEVRTRFDAKGECIADQYSGYEAVPGVKLQGKLVLGENIADLGGVKLAFQAYRQLRKDATEVTVAGGFSEDQQFFLSVGQLWCSKYRDEEARKLAKTDPHSPPRFRVNGSLSNVSEFAQAFSCAEGTKMHPAKVCEVW